MKLIFSMLINMKVFYKLILLFLMGLARHTQNTQINLQWLCYILRRRQEESQGLICTSWFKYYSYDVLYFQCSPTIESFLLSIWNPYHAFLHLVKWLCNISSLLLFQVMVGSCKQACSYFKGEVVIDRFQCLRISSSWTCNFCVINKLWRQSDRRKRYIFQNCFTPKWNYTKESNFQIAQYKRGCCSSFLLSLCFFFFLLFSRFSQ